jgi:3-deoxy-manno-octulosonate cytidylyltransferase (CMP-KDO synthetase)
VVDRAHECSAAARVVVATDSQLIAEAARAAGAEAVMTDAHLPSGTDRVAAVARADPTLAPDDVILNFQGDQPLLPGSALQGLLDSFQDGCVDMATLICPLPEEDLHNPNTVKVVCDGMGHALYFSRAAIPHARNASPAHPAAYAAHVGVYAYRKRVLLRLADSPPCALEETEVLEQLRALHLGVRIQCVPLHAPAPFEINTPEDLSRAEELWARAGGSGRGAWDLLCREAGARKRLPFSGA